MKNKQNWNFWTKNDQTKALINYACLHISHVKHVTE